MKTLSFQIPDEVYDTLAQEATRQGQSAEHEALLWLARHSPRASAATLRRNRQRRHAFERHFGEWNSGNPNAGDNRAIDADRARAVGAHES
ncbi:MAG: hypothetical protein HY343_07915 [Lentisphaerae bacterium]|nr:hypothetical protein [Lentisphaerota bacterium]